MKVCMVGVFGTGKTSLVQRFVHSKFSERYLSTVGVKIDRKEIATPGGTVNLLLWDLAGQDRFQSVQASYLRGSAGIIFVVDGTRRETLDALDELCSLVSQAIGEVPAVVTLNKFDLVGQWQLSQEDLEVLEATRYHVLRTSAKTGEGVEEAFLWLANQTQVG